PIPAKLVYQPVGPGVVRLAWQVEINETGGDHWWNMTVDAETGSVLEQHDYVVHDEWGPLDAETATAATAGAAAASASTWWRPTVCSRGRRRAPTAVTARWRWRRRIPSPRPSAGTTPTAWPGP